MENKEEQRLSYPAKRIELNRGCRSIERRALDLIRAWAHLKRCTTEQLINVPVFPSRVYLQYCRFLLSLDIPARMQLCTPRYVDTHRERKYPAPGYLYTFLYIYRFLARLRIVNRLIVNRCHVYTRRDPFTHLTFFPPLLNSTKLTRDSLIRSWNICIHTHIIIVKLILLI